MKVRSGVARRYPHSEHLRRDAEQAGRDVNRLWADMRRVRTGAAVLVSLPVAKTS
ncbi:hypothetical protein BGY98DRAFT_1040843 [Russula aff. rugulosa BPL654]|nr:hypothetical protein BGY98DRAFT_1040843 [Russula aff. rugulosa BPL654]